MKYQYFDRSIRFDIFWIHLITMKTFADDIVINGLTVLHIHPIIWKIIIMVPIFTVFTNAFSKEGGKIWILTNGILTMITQITISMILSVITFCGFKWFNMHSEMSLYISECIGKTLIMKINDMVMMFFITFYGGISIIRAFWNVESIANLSPIDYENVELKQQT